MLSIEETKKLLGDQNVSDEEAEKIRDDFRMLAEIAFEKWLKAREEEKKKENQFKKVIP